MAFVASPFVCLCGWPLYASTCSLMANRRSEQSDVNDYCGNGGERAEKGRNSDGIDWFVVAATPAAALLLMRSPASAPAPPLSLPSSTLGICAFVFRLSLKSFSAVIATAADCFCLAENVFGFGFLFLCLPHRFISRRQCFDLRCNLLKKKNRNPPVPSSFLWLVASNDFKLYHRLFPCKSRHIPKNVKFVLGLLNHHRKTSTFWPDKVVSDGIPSCNQVIGSCSYQLAETSTSTWADWAAPQIWGPVERQQCEYLF